MLILSLELQRGQTDPQNIRSAISPVIASDIHDIQEDCLSGIIALHSGQLSMVSLERSFYFFHSAPDKLC
jgi:hypothetical protein